MKQLPIIVLALACAGPLEAQTDFVFGAPPPGPTALPQALEFFGEPLGYDDLDEDRYGPLTQPVQQELGLYAVLRIFQNVCLGVEQGASLSDVTPEGYAAYTPAPYMMGEVSTPIDGTGHLVLSPTGSSYDDEDFSHPALRLRPDETGMTCQIEWYLTDTFPEDRQISMAAFLETWVPWQMALVRAEPPFIGVTPFPSGVSIWDRPCGNRWCNFQILYALGSGYVSLSATLNITHIQGNIP